MKNVTLTCAALLVGCTLFAQWENVAPIGLISVQKIEFMDVNNGFIVGTNTVPNGDAIIQKTTNGGLTWTTVLSVPPSETPSTLGFNNIEMVSSMVGYAMGGYLDPLDALLYKTTNGGINWSPIPVTVNTSRIISSHFFDENNGILVGYEVYKTTDGGQTLEVLDTPQGFYGLMDVEFVNSSTGFIIGNGSALLLKSTNGGDTWSEITLPTTFPTNDIEFINESVGYIACSSGIILKTEDAGETWTQTTVATASGSVLRGLEIVSEDIAYASSINGVILKTVDGGASWTEDYDLTDDPFVLFGGPYEIDFPSPTVGYAAGNTGRMFKNEISDGIETYAETKIRVYPNPASSTIKIDGIAIETIESIHIIGSTGQILEAIFSPITNEINVNTLSVGVYSMRITTANTTLSHSFVKE